MLEGVSFLGSLQTGHKRAQDAADKADRATQGKFQRMAYDAFLGAAQRWNDPFFTFEVRRLLAGDFPDIEDRAWGAIAKRAQKEGYVRCVGYFPSPDASTHGGPRAKWLWTGKV